jgi:hypothetical protein
MRAFEPRSFNATFHWMAFLATGATVGSHDPLGTALSSLGATVEHGVNLPRQRHAVKVYFPTYILDKSKRIF